MTGLRLRLFLALVAAPLTALALTAVITPTAFAADEKPGIAFGAPCAQAQIIIIPGSNESSELQKMNERELGVLRSAVNDLQERGKFTVRAHVIGYPAVLWPVIKGDTHTYGASRTKGYQATWKTLEYYHKQCPIQKYILIGYSQGAHVAGDLAITISEKNSPIPFGQLRSVKLLADPARDPGFPVTGIKSDSRGGIVGAFRIPIPGHAELPGIPVGFNRAFGAAGSRVTEYCAQGDAVCDYDAMSAVGMIPHGGKHVKYGDLLIPGTKQTFTQRLHDDVISDVMLLNNPTF